MVDEDVLADVLMLYSYSRKSKHIILFLPITRVHTLNAPVSCNPIIQYIPGVFRMVIIPK